MWKPRDFVEICSTNHCIFYLMTFFFFFFFFFFANRKILILLGNNYLFCGHGSKEPPKWVLKLLIKKHERVRDWDREREKERGNDIGMESSELIFCFVLLFFRAGPEAYGSSQARGRMELQPPAYTTATASPYPSHICYLHHSSWQCRILNPLCEARDRTWVLMGTSQIHFCWATTGTPKTSYKPL